MRIQTRIVLGLAIMGLLVVISSLYVFFTVNAMTGDVRRVVTRDIPNLSKLNQFQSLVGELHTLEIRILSQVPTEGLRHDFEGKLQHALDIVAQLTPFGAPSEAQMGDFKRTATQLLNSESRIRMLEEANNLFDARQLATEVIPLRTRAIELNANLLALCRIAIEENEARNLLDFNHLRDTVGLLAAVSVLIAALLITFGIRAVLAPLNRLVYVTERISHGNLNEQADDRRKDEFGLLGATINLMVGTLRQRIDEVADMNRKLQNADREHQRQLRLALNVQKSIVPRQVQIPGLDLHAHIQAARMIGGDFYDVQILQESNTERRGRRPCVGLVVGDASGSGIPASLVMVLTMTLLREAGRQTTDPSVILQRVNLGIREQFPNEMLETFVTASYIAIDLEQMRLRFASAGNEPPIHWRRSDGAVTALEVEGMFLATFEESNYRLLEMEVEEGDKILLFSDGLTESRAPDGTFFGRERLESLVGGYGHMKCKDLVERILEEVQNFRGDPLPRDDVALLAAEIEGDT